MTQRNGVATSAGVYLLLPAVRLLVAILLLEAAWCVLHADLVGVVITLVACVVVSVLPTACSRRGRARGVDA
jgi:hypothetical protein